MFSKFSALPLGSGESFLLETEHAGKTWAILVDSGKKSRRVLKDAVLAASPNLRHIDIAICTHQDADHANGFRHFAKEWYANARTIGEYWLPGRWSAALPDILTDPVGFTRRVWAGSRSVAEELSNSGRSEGALFGLEARPRDLSIQKKISSSFYDAALHGRRVETGLQGDERVQTPTNARVARSLGLGPLTSPSSSCRLTHPR